MAAPQSQLMYGIHTNSPLPGSFNNGSLKHLVANFQQLSCAIKELGNGPSLTYTPINRILEEKGLEKVLRKKERPTDFQREIKRLRKTGVSFNFCNPLTFQCEPNPRNTLPLNYFDDMFSTCSNSPVTYESLYHQTNGQHLFDRYNEITHNKVTENDDYVSNLILYTTLISDYLIGMKKSRSGNTHKDLCADVMKLETMVKILNDIYANDYKPFNLELLSNNNDIFRNMLNNECLQDKSFFPSKKLSTYLLNSSANEFQTISNTNNNSKIPRDNPKRQETIKNRKHKEILSRKIPVSNSSYLAFTEGYQELLNEYFLDKETKFKDTDNPLVTAIRPLVDGPKNGKVNLDCKVRKDKNIQEFGSSFLSPNLSVDQRNTCQERGISTLDTKGYFTDDSPIESIYFLPQDLLTG